MQIIPYTPNNKLLSSTIAFIRLRCWACVLLLFLLVSNDLSAQGANFKFGAIKFDLKGVFETVADSNITNSGTSPRRDIIFRPGLDMTGMWRLTEINTLEWTFGIAYDRYLKNGDLNSGRNFISLSPDSEVSFTILIDNITIEVIDKFSYDIDATDAVAVNSSGGEDTSVSTFERFTNELAVNTNWNMNHLVMDLELSQLDVKPRSERFKHIERTQRTALLRGTMILTRAFIVGAFVSFSTNEYATNFQNGSSSIAMGPSFQYQYSPLLIFAFDGSYSVSSFDNNGNNQDSSEPKSIGLNFRVKHRWSRSYNHALALSRSSSFGFVSNTTTTNRIAYLWTWKAFKWSDIDGDFSYSRKSDSGGANPEKFDRYSGKVGIGYTINKQTGMKLTYDYSKKNSNIEGRSFPRHRVSFRIDYDF